MSKHHKSPLAGKVPPPTPSAAVENAAAQIVAERTTAFSPVFEAPYGKTEGAASTNTGNIGGPVTGLHTVQEPSAAELGKSFAEQMIVNLRDGVAAEKAKQVMIPVPKAHESVTILFKFSVVDEGEIEQTGTFLNMTDANAWLDKVKHEGVTLNSKARPQAEWYSPYYIRKIVAKPIIKDNPSAA